jgi:hypothetical protein
MPTAGVITGFAVLDILVFKPMSALKKSQHDDPSSRVTMQTF